MESFTDFLLNMTFFSSYYTLFSVDDPFSGLRYLMTSFSLDIYIHKYKVFTDKCTYIRKHI